LSRQPKSWRLLFCQAQAYPLQEREEHGFLAVPQSGKKKNPALAAA
jgi:hypothetical protein